MTDQNNAAQAIQEAERNAAVEEYFGHRTWIKPTASNFRLFEAGFDRAYALLSKLRAEGVQAGDERESFSDWAWKKDGLAIGHMDGQAAAWEAWQERARRAALASAPVAHGSALDAVQALEPPFASRRGNEFREGYLEAKVDAVRALRRVASAPVAGEAQPVTLYQARTRPAWRTDENAWTKWEDCTAEQAADYERVPLLHDWQYEVRRLYAAPQASEAVRIFFPTHLRKMWSGGEVQAWLDEYQGLPSMQPSAKGSLERYRQWQAEQTQADKDGGDCAKGAGDE